MRYHLTVAGDKFDDNGAFDLGNFPTVEGARDAYLAIQWADVYYVELLDRATGITTYPKW